MNNQPQPSEPKENFEDLLKLNKKITEIIRKGYEEGYVKINVLPL